MPHMRRAVIPLARKYQTRHGGSRDVVSDIPLLHESVAADRRDGYRHLLIVFRTPLGCNRNDLQFFRTRTSRLGRISGITRQR